MAYQVIARKWRPQRFDDVVGQQAVTRTLRNALQSGRLAQAFVFAGPRGVGKTTSAAALGVLGSLSLFLCQSGRTCTLRNRIAPPGTFFGRLPNCSAIGPLRNCALSISAVFTPFSITVMFFPRAVMS